MKIVFRLFLCVVEGTLKKILENTFKEILFRKHFRIEEREFQKGIARNSHNFRQMLIIIESWIVTSLKFLSCRMEIYWIYFTLNLLQNEFFLLKIQHTLTSTKGNNIKSKRALVKTFLTRSFFLLNKAFKQTKWKNIFL